MRTKRLMRGAPSAAAGLTLALATTLAQATDGDQGDNGGRHPPPAVTLAEDLLDGIPPGSHVAIRPLDLPGAVGSRLYESLLSALHDSAGGSVTLLARESLLKVYESLEEFYHPTDPEALLRKMQADTEIMCTTESRPEGVTLRCSGTGIRVETGRIQSRGSARFPWSDQAEYRDLLIAEIARKVVGHAPTPGRLGSTRLLDATTGAQTDISAFISRRLEQEVMRRMEEVVRRASGQARAAEVLATAPEADSDTPVYRLRGSVRGHQRSGVEWVGVEAHLWAEESGSLPPRPLPGAAEDIPLSSLPPGLASGGVSSPAGRFHEAVAEAVLSERLDRRGAERGARNLARARVISQALDLPPPKVIEVASEADAVEVLSHALGKGLTVEERFSYALPEGDAGGNDRVAVRLTARVTPTGAIIRPAVTARLDKPVYEAMEPMSIEIRSDEAAHLGVFAWGADGKVVRLYPRGTRKSLPIGAGNVVVLPRSGEGSILSVPLPEPGNEEDHEAFIVVAKPRPIDFAALAPEAGTNLSDTMNRAVEGSGFFGALAGRDPARMAVIFLPYRVHR